MVDSDIIEDEAEKSRLREIERRIFDVIREDKTKQGFKGVWNGTKVIISVIKVNFRGVGSANHSFCRNMNSSRDRG